MRLRETVARGIADAVDHTISNRAPWNRAAEGISRIGANAGAVVIQGGIATDESMYEPMRRFLANAGFEEITVVRSPKQTLSSIRGDALALKQAVEGAVERSLANGGDGKVSILAHSKGGLIARDYLQNLNGAANVRQLITVGTPHRGYTILSPRLSKFIGKVVPNSAVRDLEASTGVAKGLNQDLPEFMRRTRAANPDFRLVSLAGDTGIGSDMLVTVPSTIPQALVGVYHHVFRDIGANHGSIAGCITGLHTESARTIARLLAGQPFNSALSDAQTAAQLLT